MTRPLSRRVALALACITAAAALAFLGTMTPLLLGDFRLRSPIPGIPEASSAVQWFVPTARTFWRLFSVTTIGLMLGAAALLPSAAKELSRAATRTAALAAVSSLLAGCTALFLVVVSSADTFAAPISWDPIALWSYASNSQQGAAWVVSAALAAIAAMIAVSARSAIGAWLGLSVAIAATLPPAAVGHAASAGNHDLATSALLVHVGSSSLWVGGLLMLVGIAWIGQQQHDKLMIAATRFSALALPLYIAVGVSGVVGAVLRINSIGQLTSSTYGAVVATKALIFFALGVIGYLHRRFSLRQLDNGSFGSFRRLVVVEAGILLITLGLSGALSSIPPPGGAKQSPSGAELLLGFALPPAPSLFEILTSWRADVLISSVLVSGYVLYGLGIARLRRRGDSWSVWRAIAWFTGMAILTVGTLSGLSAYGRVSFSLHMVQHMTLSMVAPLLLALAAPITLALRALPAASGRGHAGPREWLLSALHSPVARTLTHPLTALALFITAPYLVYFSDLFELAMRNHWAHLLMQAHFILVGFLFYQTLIGTDPLPFRFPYPLRLICLMIALASHSFFAIALMSSDVAIAADYYSLLDRPWWPDLLREQTVGASFVWAFGEIPGVLVLVALLFRWSRDDDQRARQIDRAADRDSDAELAAYNQHACFTFWQICETLRSIKIGSSLCLDCV